MPVFGATLEMATLFFTYNFVQGKLRDLNGMNVSSSSKSSSSSLEADAERPLSMKQLSVAAAAAGIVTSFVLTPIELVKCKMQVQMVSREMEWMARNASQEAGSTLRGTAAGAVSSSNSARAGSTKAFAGLDGPVKIVRQILRQEGPSGLWLGQTGTLLRETGGGIAWFLGFEWACRTMIKRKRQQSGREDVSKKDLSSVQLMGAGALAGISYNVVLFPADSVKSTMQTDRELSGTKAKADGTAWKKSGFLATFRRIYTTKGIRGLYAGCAVTCLRSAPSSGIVFLLYNKLEGLADDYGI
jgi:ornithine carrier protein